MTIRKDWEDIGIFTETMCICTGVKEFSGQEGEPFVTVYEDGAAEFSFDDEGCIIWKDENETGIHW